MNIFIPGKNMDFYLGMEGDGSSRVWGSNENSEFRVESGILPGTDDFLEQNNDFSDFFWTLNPIQIDWRIEPYCEIDNDGNIIAFVDGRKLLVRYQRETVGDTDYYSLSLSVVLPKGIVDEISHLLEKVLLSDDLGYLISVSMCDFIWPENEREGLLTFRQFRDGEALVLDEFDITVSIHRGE